MDIDDFLLTPLVNIKTNHDSDEYEEEIEDTLTNTVLLEEDVKVEPIIEMAPLGEDPLNILSKFEMKIEIGEHFMAEEFPVDCQEFIGEYNDHDLLADDADLKAAAAEVPPTQEPYNEEGGPSKSKRMRISVGALKGRNGYVWSTVKPAISANPFNNKASTLMPPRGKGPAKTVGSVLEAWHLLLDEPILQCIVKHTNEEIKKRKVRTLSALSYQRSTDLTELRAWLGLNYLCGIFCTRPTLTFSGTVAAGGTVEELWTPELGNGIFRATMSLKRFEFLSNCLRFAEHMKISKRDLKTDTPNIQAVRGVWEKFVINCRSYYAPSRNCTLAEHIVDCVGTAADMSCPKLSLPDAPEKCGIRLVSLHDAKTLYMCNAALGQSSVATKDEVLALVCDIKGTARNVTLSKRYTGLDLANNLLQCQLSLVGALEAQAKEIPAEFKSKAKNNLRQLYAGTISLVAHENSHEMLLTSGVSDKISATKLHKATQQAGRRFHETASCFSTSAASLTSTSATNSCWQLRFFQTMLDFACTNAWLIFRLSDKGDTALQQRDFQRQLGLFLAQQHLKRRLQRNSRISLQLKLLISEILGEPSDWLISEAVSAAAQANSAGSMPTEKATIPDTIQLLTKTTEKRSRCRKCPSKQNNKTRWQCQQCARSLCLTHLIMRCDDCTGVKNVPKESDEHDEYFK